MKKDNVDSACTDVGFSDYANKIGDGGNDVGSQYLPTENRFIVDCCGVLTSWSIYTHNTGTLSLQVWRLVSGTTYELIGENIVTVSTTGDNTFTISSPTEQIAVESGDLVGWYSSGNDIIDWENAGGGGNFNYKISNTVATTVGNTATFGSQVNARFALMATFSETVPTFTNIPFTITFSRQALSQGVSIFRVNATYGSGGTITLSLESSSPSSAFNFDASTGDVSPASASTPTATYVLEIKATSTCSTDIKEDLTIIITNTIPVLYDMPVAVDVSESAVDETLITLLNVTDADGDDVTCSVTTSPFFVKFANDGAGGVTQGIYMQANPSLDYSTTNAYTITVSCTDGEDTAYGTAYVFVIQNNVPVISNLQNTTSITSTVPSNTLIFQVLYSDVENDQTTFTLACVPTTPCPFVIYSTGSIYLSESLVGSSTSAFEVDITVADQYSTSGTHRLVVYVTDLNTVPEITNLPATIQVTEDTAIGTTLFTLSVYDEDGQINHQFASSYSPASGAGIFSISDSTRSLTLDTTLNYISQATAYNLTVDVNDGQATSNPTWLYIEIVNVNQIPVLQQSVYQIQSDEAPAGTNLPNPSYRVYDPDGDNLTYSFASSLTNTNGFSIDKSTGVISLTLDFDREDSGLDPPNRSWLVVISDPEGLSVTATLSVSILDVNDNTPRMLSPSYSGRVYTNADINTVIATATASDDDATSVNRRLEYVVSGTSLFNVDGLGNILVFASLSNYGDTQHSFTLTVRNPGMTTNDTASVSVYVENTTSDSFWDKPVNIALVTLGIILGLIVASGLGYLACKAMKTTPLTHRKITQVAPSDTKMPKSPPPRTAETPPRSPTPPPYSLREPVTPSDIRYIDSQWTAWNRDSFF